jgi:hypothetical protein
MNSVIIQGSDKKEARKLLKIKYLKNNSKMRMCKDNYLFTQLLGLPTRARVG